MEAFNDVEDIKLRLLLESSNQTISDEVIKEYVEEANDEMFDLIKRNYERDVFYCDDSNKSGFELYFPAQQVLKVLVDGEELSIDEYSLELKNRVVIGEVDFLSKVEVFYIPYVYTLFERSIAIVNLMTRLNPLVGEETSTVYLNWSNKKKKYESSLLGKFGVGSYGV